MENFYFSKIRKKYNFSLKEFCYDFVITSYPGASSSDGKSKNIFYYSGTGRYIIKQMSKREMTLFIDILNDYTEHLLTHGHTLIIKYLAIL